MKTLLETEEKAIHVDGDTLIKVGPAASIDWEAHILDVLRRVRGVPRVRGITTSLGGRRRTLIMDLLPGKPVTDTRGGVLPQLLNILSAIYEAGVAHMRIKKENVLYGSGLVGLIGFSKACLLEANPMAYFPRSPDMIGEVGAGFTLNGPLAVPEGCYADLINMGKE